MSRKLTHYLKKTDGSVCWVRNKGLQRFFNGGFRLYMIPFLTNDGGYGKVFDFENQRILLRVSEQKWHFDRWSNSNIGYYYMSLKSLKDFQKDYRRHKETWKKLETKPYD